MIKLIIINISHVQPNLIIINISNDQHNNNKQGGQYSKREGHLKVRQH